MKRHITTIWAITLALAAVANGPSAQSFDVPGDFATPQDALDAAPSGALIVVHGGSWDAMVISKPVTLVGEPRATIGGPPFPTGTPVLLSGPGAGVVTLCNFEIGGVFSDSFLSASPPPGISGSGFDQLHLKDCYVIAPNRGLGFTGLGYGSGAVTASVELLVLEGTFAVGGGSGIDSACPHPIDNLEPPPAIGAQVAVLIDSGGQGGNLASFQQDGCDPTACPQVPGGAGIVCSELYYTGSYPPARGGVPASWLNCSLQYCCQSDPGPDVVASKVVSIPSALAAKRFSRMGESLWLDITTPGPLARLLFAFDFGTPLEVPGLGYYFLDPSTTRSVGVVASPGRLENRIPYSSYLIGKKLCFQAIDPTSGYTNPVSSIVLPPQKQYEAPPP